MDAKEDRDKEKETVLKRGVTLFEMRS